MKVILRDVTATERECIASIVDIHLQAFDGFFLTFLGRGFLNEMYKSYCIHPQSGLFIAIEDEQVLGFLAYSKNMSNLYRYMIKNRLLVFIYYSLGAFLKKPLIFFRLIRAFLKPSEVKRDEAYIELSSIGVLPGMQASGIGTRLIDELKGRVRGDVISYINLETDTLDNDAANIFYNKNGFKLERTYFTQEGRQMNEYRWYPDKTF